jgi:hypothetical protein
VIPLATSTITVQRVASTVGQDGYDPDQPGPSTVASGVRAVVTPPSASVALSGGDRVVYTGQLTCDPVDLRADDTVTDSTSGLTWMVLWAQPVNAVGLTFVRAQLRLVQGEGF